MYNKSENIRSGPMEAKPILFVAQQFVSVKVINNLLFNNRDKEFSDDIKEADLALL